MERFLCWGMLCLLGLGLLHTHAFEVEIKNASDTCIYASIDVNFTIQYENVHNTTSNVTFVAPDKVTTNGSSCEPPLLNVIFGNGQSWSLNFTKTDTEYRGDVLTFTYNTSDSTLFPDAKRQGLLTSVAQKSFFSPVPLNASYKCLHADMVNTENVFQLYWNVTLQAYVQNSTLGKEVHCIADTSTTAVPTTLNATTLSPPKPTPKPVDKPTVGNYSVTNGTDICLLASMGVQLNASILIESKSVWTQININPNTTGTSGSCGNESALLRLTDSNSTTVEFYFLLSGKKFHLQEVNVTLANGSGTYHRANANLSLWEASSESSYLCHKEQRITVSEDLYVNTFDVRVQPFSVKNATYATAEDCFADENFTVPIIVGAALGVLVILVVVAYFIGRRNRRSAGYEHFQ